MRALKLVGIQGLEPWTSASQTPRSTRLSYIPFKIGCRGGTRTPVVWLMRPSWNHLQSTLRQKLFIALRTDGPYIFTIPFSGISKGSQPPLNTLLFTSQALPIMILPHNCITVCVYSTFCQISIMIVLQMNRRIEKSCRK